MRKATIAGFACVSFVILRLIPHTPAFAGPNFKAAYDRIGEISATTAAQGQYLEAAQEFEEVVTTWREERYLAAGALFWAGTMYQKAGELKRAIETFKRVLDEYPQQLEPGVWARVAMANDCYFALGQYHKGLAMLLEMVLHSSAYEGSGAPGCGTLLLPWARDQLLEYLRKAASAYSEQGRPGEFAHLIRGTLTDNWCAPVWEMAAEAMLALG